jgi:hypothetical protein
MSAKGFWKWFGVWAGTHLAQAVVSCVCAYLDPGRGARSSVSLMPCLLPVLVAELSVYFSRFPWWLKALLYVATLGTQGVAFFAGFAVYLFREQPW